MKTAKKSFAKGLIANEADVIGQGDGLAHRGAVEGLLADVLQVLGQVDSGVVAEGHGALLQTGQSAGEVDPGGFLVAGQGIVAQIGDALADVDGLITVACKGTLVHEFDAARDVQHVGLPSRDLTIQLQLALPAKVAEGLIADGLQVGRQRTEGTDVEHLVKGAVAGLLDGIGQIQHGQNRLVLEQEAVRQLGDGIGAAVALVGNGGRDGEGLGLGVVADGSDTDGGVGGGHIADAVHGELTAKVGGVGRAVDQDLVTIAGVAQELGLLGGLSVHDTGLILKLVVPEVEGVLTDLLHAGADHAVLHAVAVDKGTESNGPDGIRNLAQSSIVIGM